MGLVLGRQIDDHTLATARFSVIQHSMLLSSYFPLAPASPLPFPTSGSGRTVGDIAEAFGMPAAHVRPLVDELVWAGILRIGPSSRDGEQ